MAFVSFVGYSRNITIGFIQVKTEKLLLKMEYIDITMSVSFLCAAFFALI